MPIGIQSNFSTTRNAISVTVSVEKIGLCLKEGKRPAVVPGWGIKLLVDEVE